MSTALKFYNFSEFKKIRFERTFKHSVRREAIALAIATQVIIILTSFFLFAGMHGMVYSFILFFCLLFWKMIFHSFRARLKPTNIVLGISSGHYFVKTRSYMNTLSDNDTQAFSFAAKSVEWVRERREKSTLPALETTKTVNKRFLELKVNWEPEEIKQVEKLLADERAYVPPVQGFSRTKYHGYLVSFSSEKTLLIDWADLFPKLDEAVETLGLETLETVTSELDYNKFLKMPADEQKREILRMTEQGMVIDAIKLAKMAFKLSATEANKYVYDILEPKK